MAEITEEQKMVIRELRARLNGNCSSYMGTCPRVIAEDLFTEDQDIWSCIHCQRHFFLVSKSTLFLAMSL